MDAKDLGLDPITFNKVDQMAWDKAFSMIASRADETLYQTHRDALDALLEATEEIPDGISIWEPFEHWELCGIQSLIDDFHDSLLYLAKDLLAVTGRLS